MSEKQQYELGSYVNLMYSSTQLLVNPIKGIQPKYNSEDLDQFIAWQEKKADAKTCDKYRDLIVSLANFLYKIELNDRDKRLLWKALRRNKKMLKSMDISKKEFDMSIFEAVYEALNYKYSGDNA